MRKAAPSYGHSIFSGARDLLIKAIAADPHYPLAHSALSEAPGGIWAMQRKARAEAQQALDLSAASSTGRASAGRGTVPPGDRRLAKAVQAYQSLFNLFPDRLDYGLLSGLGADATSNRPTRCRPWRPFAIFRRRRATMRAST